VRFLIDENLSPRLVVALRASFPDSVHVETLRLRGCDDSRVWEAARAEGLVILTKDDDFNARSVLLGAPPKVVHLRVGNVATSAVIHLLLERRTRILAFGEEGETSLLVLP